MKEAPKPKKVPKEVSKEVPKEESKEESKEEAKEALRSAFFLCKTTEKSHIPGEESVFSLNSDSGMELRIDF